jgi:CPA2 family monovalent cation:H+ antiporter-2
METILLQSPAHLPFIQDLAVVIVVAAAAMIVFKQLRQPVVLGYILAGLAIGPHTPPFSLISSAPTIETLAELGVIFLMFSLGLEFNLGKLKKVGATAFLGAFMEITLMIAVGYQLGRFFGWSQMDSIFLGAILSVSSTTIIIKALDELGKIKERFASLIFGILIVEDIMSIAMIALLSGLASTGTLGAGEVGVTLLELSAFLAALLVGGLLVVPRLLAYVAKLACDEVMLVTVIGICFGVAFLTAKMGYSVALGAFVIGAIIAEARSIHRIERMIRPVRDLFSAIFFVSIGLLIDPKLILEHWVPVSIISLAVIVGKVVSCGLGALLAGNDSRTSLRVGMGLSQIGEFSFIMASVGVSLKATSEFLYPITVAVSAVTTLTTPYLIRSSDSVVGWFDRTAPAALVGWMETYSRWVGRLGNNGGQNIGLRILKRITWQTGLNVLLIVAIFLGIRFAYEQLRLLEALASWSDETLRGALWLAGMLLNLPLLIAIWRNLEAAALVIAEICVPETELQRINLRFVVSHTIKMALAVLTLILILLLTITILPSLPTVGLLLVLIMGVATFSYRAAVRAYASAQFALHETFAQPADEEVHFPLRESSLETVVLSQGGAPIGRTIVELNLRDATGASIVGIERDGENILNPDPEEEMQIGDRVVLIGTSGQLHAARKFLND